MTVQQPNGPQNLGLQRNQNQNTGMTPLSASHAAALFNQAATTSGLVNLSQDKDAWHDTMGETYGYDPSEDSDAKVNSEEIRIKVQQNDWSGVNIASTSGDTLLGKDAAFIGGDTADSGDDRILVNEDTLSQAVDENDSAALNNLNNAVTEELFHSFERQIYEGEDGDVQLVDDKVAFAERGSGSALDEGQLGTALLGGAEDAETARSENESIAADDHSEIEFANGDTVEAEFSEPTMTFADDAGLGVTYDPDTYDQYLNAVKTGNFDAMDINHAFMSGLSDRSAIVYSEDGSRDYSIYGEGLDRVQEDTLGGWTAATSWLEELPPELNGAQAVQDYLGYVLHSDTYPDITADYVFDWDQFDSLEYLNSFTFEQLNNETTATDGIRLNPEVLQYFPAAALLGLDDNKSQAESIQHALELKHLQVEGTDGIEAATETLSGDGAPHSMPHDSIIPLDLGATELQEKYMPRLGLFDAPHPYTAVGAEGNWNAGLAPTGTSDHGASSSGYEQVIARTATSAEVPELPDDVTAIQYSYYFPKDNGLHIPQVGHRHDWEDAIVYVKDAGLETEELIGAAYSGHGYYSGSADPYRDENDQVYVQYAYNDNSDKLGEEWTHSFAERGTSHYTYAGELIENQTAADYTDVQTLVDYDNLPDAAVTTLNSAAGTFDGFDAYGKAVVPMKDADFADNILAGYAALGL